MLELKQTDINLKYTTKRIPTYKWKLKDSCTNYFICCEYTNFQ